MSKFIASLFLIVGTTLFLHCSNDSSSTTSTTGITVGSEGDNQSTVEITQADCELGSISASDYSLNLGLLSVSADQLGDVFADATLSFGLSVSLPVEGGTAVERPGNSFVIYYDPAPSGDGNGVNYLNHSGDGAEKTLITLDTVPVLNDLVIRDSYAISGQFEITDDLVVAPAADPNGTTLTFPPQIIPFECSAEYVANIGS